MLNFVVMTLQSEFDQMTKWTNTIRSSGCDHIDYDDRYIIQNKNGVPSSGPVKREKFPCQNVIKNN